MFTISNAAEIFAELDNVPEERRPQLDKALRNLTQRAYVPATSKDGRALVYDLPGLAGLRLVYLAQAFNLDRVLLDRFSLWLWAFGSRTREVPGGLSSQKHLEEAIERVRAGEDFAFRLSLRADGQIFVDPTWTRDHEPSPRIKRTLELAEAMRSPVIGTYEAPASAILRALLHVVPGAE